MVPLLERLRPRIGSPRVRKRLICLISGPMFEISGLVRPGRILRASRPVPEQFSPKVGPARENFEAESPRLRAIFGQSRTDPEKLWDRVSPARKIFQSELARSGVIFAQSRTCPQQFLSIVGPARSSFLSKSDGPGRTLRPSRPGPG